jgi:hypothetical protein
MRSELEQRLSAMRREAERRMREWVQVKEEFAARARQRPIPVEVEVLRELDRLCDVEVLPPRIAQIRGLAV